jgi:hypothetical protein
MLEQGTEKSGRRLQGAKLSQVQEALATLGELVKWASYADSEPASAGDAGGADGDGSKATSDNDGLHADQEKRSEKYGIAAKNDGALTYPAGYPTSEGLYGDPVNYKYPLDSGRVQSAVGYFNHDGQQEKGGYTPEEWAIIGGRIASAASRHWGTRYAYRDGKVEQAESGDEDEGKSYDMGYDNSVKAIGSNRIGGYLILWGDDSRKDLTEEYFTQGTEEVLSIYKAMGALPVLYHHARDRKVKSEVVGQIDFLDTDDVGVWAEAQLLAASKYRGAIQELARQGALGWSSGTLPGARQVAPNGKITRWPIMEGSLTPTPAEWRMVERPVSEIKSAWDALGIGVPSEIEQEIAKEMELLRLIELES